MVADKLYCYMRSSASYRTSELFFTGKHGMVNEAEPELFNSSQYTYRGSVCVNKTLLCTNEMLNW